MRTNVISPFVMRTQHGKQCADFFDSALMSPKRALPGQPEIFYVLAACREAIALTKKYMGFIRPESGTRVTSPN